MMAVLHTLVVVLAVVMYGLVTTALSPLTTAVPLVPFVPLPASAEPTLPPSAQLFLMVELQPAGECHTAQGGVLSFLRFATTTVSTCKTACLAASGCSGVTFNGSTCSLHPVGAVETTGSADASCLRRDPVEATLSCSASSSSYSGDTTNAADTVSTAFPDVSVPDHLFFFSAPANGTSGPRFVRGGVRSPVAYAFGVCTFCVGMCVCVRKEGSARNVTVSIHCVDA